MQHCALAVNDRLHVLDRRVCTISSWDGEASVGLEISDRRPRKSWQVVHEVPSAPLALFAARVQTATTKHQTHTILGLVVRSSDRLRPTSFRFYVVMCMWTFVS